MKFIKLLTSAYVNGQLRHPHEGALHLEDEEAQRLIDNAAGEDVSDGFTAKQDREAPAETLEAAEDAAPDLEPAPHLAEVAPEAAAQPEPKKEKGK